MFVFFSFPVGCWKRSRKTPTPTGIVFAECWRRIYPDAASITFVCSVACSSVISAYRFPNMPQQLSTRNIQIYIVPFLFLFILLFSACSFCCCAFAVSIMLQIVVTQIQITQIYSLKPPTTITSMLCRRSRLWIFLHHRNSLYLLVLFSSSSSFCSSHFHLLYPHRHGSRCGRIQSYTPIRPRIIIIILLCWMKLFVALTEEDFVGCSAADLGRVWGEVRYVFFRFFVFCCFRCASNGTPSAATIMVLLSMKNTIKLSGDIKRLSSSLP